MRPDPNPNLVMAPVSDFTRWLARAADMGAGDYYHGLPKRTGKEVVEELGIRKWRAGHVRYLQRAYAAGRWHAEVSAK